MFLSYGTFLKYGFLKTKYKESRYKFQSKYLESFHIKDIITLWWNKTERIIAYEIILIEPKCIHVVTFLSLNLSL